MEEFAKQLGFTGSATAIILFVLGLFWKGDDAFSVEFRKELSKSILDFRIDGNSSKWPVAFLGVFERIFKKNHFTGGCFRNSAIASLVFFVILITLFYSLDIGHSESIEKYISIIFDHGTVGAVVFTATLLIIVGWINIIGDYASLFETRFILYLMIKSEKFKSVSALLLLDVALSITIFLAVYLIFSYSFFAITGRQFNLSDTLINIIQDDITLAMLATSLLTSLWLWIYYLGLIALQLTLYFRPVLFFFQHALNIKEKPVRSIGVMASIVTATLLVLISLLRLLF